MGFGVWGLGFGVWGLPGIARNVAAVSVADGRGSGLRGDDDEEDCSGFWVVNYGGLVRG